MRRFLTCLVLALSALTPTGPSHAQELKLWLDGLDNSSMTISGNNVVEQWRDKSGLNNHLNRIQFTPTLIPFGGVELIERQNGQCDALAGTALLAAERQEFAMVLACVPYFEAIRLFAFAGNHMSLLRDGNFADDRLALQTLNNCKLLLSPALISPRHNVQIYAMRRIPNGAGSDNTLWRKTGNRVDGFDPCFTAELHTLRFDNGSLSFPTSLEKGMIMCEVFAFAGAIFPRGAGLLGESQLTDAFIEGKMQELYERWVEEPTTVQPSTWGRIKLLAN